MIATRKINEAQQYFSQISYANTTTEKLETRKSTTLVARGKNNARKCFSVFFIISLVDARCTISDLIKQCLVNETFISFIKCLSLLRADAPQELVSQTRYSGELVS